MPRPHLRSFLAIATSLGLAACPDVRPGVNGSTPDADVPDAPSDIAPDLAPPVDVAPDRMDASTDAPADVAPDLTPIDVPPGTTWCDLPMGPDAEVRGVTLPAGFCVRRYGRLQHARVMAFSPTGDLFIASPSTTGPGGTGPGIAAIAILPDDNRDGVADGVVRYVQRSAAGPTGVAELDTVHGLLFREGSLLYTTQNGVWRVPFRAGDRALAQGTVPDRVADLSDSERWTHTLAAGPDGTLYVSMGIYGSSQCPYPQPRRGAILAIGTGHAAMGDVVARGFRNPMYLRCHAWGCYAAELTDDGWTAPGHEKIVRFSNGQDYGYPCCYDRGRPSPANAGSVSCSGTMQSMVGFPVGYTPFGHDFERGEWPAPYGYGLFVGLHGQVGSWSNTGINWAPADPATRAFMGSDARTFLGGWGRGTPNEGRVADLVFAPDGRMFFTDDQLGQVYWIAPRTLRMPAR